MAWQGIVHPRQCAASRAGRPARRVSREAVPPRRDAFRLPFFSGVHTASRAAAASERGQPPCCLPGDSQATRPSFVTVPRVMFGRMSDIAGTCFFCHESPRRCCPAGRGKGLRSRQGWPGDGKVSGYYILTRRQLARRTIEPPRAAPAKGLFVHDAENCLWTMATFLFFLSCWPLPSSPSPFSCCGCAVRA